jgi:hypothetical protein
MVTDPFGTATVPTPLSIEALLALLLVQESVVELPDVIVDNEAMNVPVGAGTTVTVAVLVTVAPAAFVSVKV